MDYLKAYKSFVNSHYLNEGIRMTAGILFPAFLLSIFDLLDTGIVFSLGALFVSLTDSPGPIQHRKNGMLVCVLVIFILSLISGLVDQSPVLLGLFILVCCFVFTMISVYGARAGSIGIAALVLLVLNVGHERHGSAILQNALYMSSGGLWYMCFSMLLYNFRPYKILQQALGDWIQSIAEYLTIRAELYKRDVVYEDIFKQLLQQQAVVQEKQNMVNELIFKTRSVVKENTHIGRVLVMLYLDTADIFEKIMTSYQRYSVLHEYFDETGLLEKFHHLALTIAGDLNDIGIAVKSGIASSPNTSVAAEVKAAEEQRLQLRQTFMKPDNMEGFISIKRITENIQDLEERLQTLHKYTTYDRSLKKRRRHEVDYEDFITHQPVKPQLLFDNLTLQADIFRHALRLSVAVMVGYIASFLFDIGHKAWILLTIIVILKPAYSLTKKRNRDRLLGTILGVVIGVLILQFIDNPPALLVLMVLFMGASFTVMRISYFLMVLLMTPYLIIFFHLMNPNDFRQLLTDRVVDTAIGSLIAFAASVLLMPRWERQKIKPLMTKMLEQAIHYFSKMAQALENSTGLPTQDQQLARRQTLVALANLSDAFNRMLSEPKVQQKGIEEIHRFVVLNHMLTSYIATLSHFIKKEGIAFSGSEMKAVIEEIKSILENAMLALEGAETVLDNDKSKQALHKLVSEANALMEKRLKELENGFVETPTRKQLFEVKSIADQMNLIHKAASDIYKVITTIPPNSHL